MEDSVQVTMRSLKDQFMKKLSEQETLIQKLKLSNTAQKKLAELGDN